MRPIWTLTAAAALIGLMGAGPAPAQDAPAPRDITVVLANPSAINITPVWTAIGEGYFADEGLKVTIQAVNGSAAVLQAVAAGQAEIGQPGAGPTINARAGGLDVQFFYNLNPQSAFGVLVPADSGVASPEDLRGKVIGVGTADGAETAFARTIMTDAGMEEGDDYEFLVVGDGGLAVAGFTRGDIDAYAAATSDGAILNQRGLAMTNITPDKFRTYFGNGFVALAPFIAENPDVIEGFGRAVARGSTFAMDPANIETVLKHTAAGNPQEGEDQDFARALTEAIIARQTPPEGKRLGENDPAAWKAWHDSLLASGDLAEPLPDLEAAYNNDFVDAWSQER
ncbi:MAG: ABC transporter substrate-binding protein [Aurantimonas endophytica]|uniref:NitT/TauT family transport system substrate-binding protein n=1 Tax=Aurantimonas endophytica TaxID=1522175 RepID=A0A7W6HEK4_9HYPH|nr:ABC transporter substrate-binding protein [Aurantimonas endophytica]MBB4003567.1 NitT/TauT family transport system substrate-binding protein [Aurantimonas endophytica]MCO6404425.1 ABC transporter substrate-binding protein [Aurantimonas endophytica]